eukprot:g4828.t1
MFHSETSGCMGSLEAQCCCCEKEGFADPLNELMKKEERLKLLWGFNPSCKDAPLQCDPNIDCEACRGAKKCERNPTENELKGIDLAKTNCENTESASTCDDFACKAGYVKQGSATCMNGEWSLANAKCLAPCNEDPSFDHIDNSKSSCVGTPHGGKCSFLCEEGYSPSSESARATCNDGEWMSGSYCMKDDWCKLKEVPTTRIKEFRLKPKPPRTDWDRGKELVARKNFRCGRGARVRYTIPKAELKKWTDARNNRQGSHRDVYKADFPPSPVDLCEEACRDVTVWRPEVTKFQSRGFSLFWSQRSMEEVEDEYEQDPQELYLQFKKWRGKIPPPHDKWEDPVCYCEAGDSKICLAEQNTESHQEEGLYWRYDYELEKDETTPAKIAFKTSYSWDELRDTSGPFETPEWFEKPQLSTEDKIFGPNHQGLAKCDNDDKSDPCIDKHPDGYAPEVLTVRSCTPSSPCGVCRGDCNSDDDCAGHLRCWQRSDNAMKLLEIDRLVRLGPVVNNKLYYADRVPGCRNSDYNDGGMKNRAYTCKDSKRSPHKISCGAFANSDGSTDIETETSEHDLHMDFCYDPNLLSAKCKADPPQESIVSGVLTGGQTCNLEEAVVVPACTELTLQGVAAPHSTLANAPAIISGSDRTNHFDVNGKLTLKNLILERGLAFDYRGGSLHVSGFEALVHLIETTIRDCTTTRDPAREIHGYEFDSVKIHSVEGAKETISGGAIFLTPGDVEPMRGHNDGVRLILEGSTIEGNSAEVTGGAIFSRGSTIEVWNGTTVLRKNSAFPEYADLIDGTNILGEGGGIFMKLTGGLVVRGPESVLWFDSNEAFYGGGGISLKGWLPHVSSRPEDWNSPEIIVEDGGTLKFSNNRAVVFGGAMKLEAQRDFRINPHERYSIPPLHDLCKLSKTNQLRIRRISGGGGITVSPGSILRLDGSSDFSHNSAALSNGGGINAPPFGKNDGSGACVDIQVSVLQASSTEYFKKNFPGNRKYRKRENSTLQVSPRVAQLDTILSSTRKKGLYYYPDRGAQRTDELNALSACVPCGAYEMVLVPTKWVTPYSDGTRITITHTTPEGRIVTFLNSTEPGRNTLVAVTFNVGCDWTGLRLKRARFFNNTAVRGGAVSIEARKNLLFDVSNTTFAQNIALGSRGGAVQLSGTGIGARFSSECTFERNVVSDGSGGAISVESSASLVLTETRGSGNLAGSKLSRSENCRGGFVYASFASSLFVRNVNLENNVAMDGGAFVARLGGGAISAENAPHQKGMMMSSQSHFEGNTAITGDGGAVYESSNLDRNISHWDSTRDKFMNNMALSGSGGALAMVRTRARLDDASLCTGNQAPLGGGGCLFWEPQSGEGEKQWDECRPQHSERMFKDARANMAAFGHNLGTGGRSLDHNQNDLKVNAEDKSFPPGASPVLTMRDYYGNQIIRKEGVTGILEGSVLVTSFQETESESKLGGAISEALKGPQGNATFDSLLLTELPDSGPHFLSFQTTINVGKSLTRVVKSRSSLTVRVGKCPHIGIKDCACPHGQVKVGHRCMCDGAAIVKQVASLGFGQHQEAMPIHYYPEGKATYLIGYFNASNTSAAGMATCPNRDDQDDFGFCCAPCLMGADCFPCANQTVQIITKEELEAGRIKPKCVDADQRYSLENHELTALPGYWKATRESSEFMDCAIAFQGGASIGKVFSGVLVVLAVLFFVLTYLFLKADVPKDGKKKKKNCTCCKKKSKKGETKNGKEVDSNKKHIEVQREKEATTRFLADQSLTGRVQGSSMSGSASHSGEVLQMDYSIEVGGARHANVKILIAAGIILY